MKGNVSKILAAAAAIVLLAGPVLASEATNDTTGANSTNNASITFSNETSVENNNNAWVDNNAWLNSNTGGNSASMNTGDGTINTGNAGIELVLENQFNMNETSIEGNLNGSGTVGNSNTGFNSENNASITEENEINVENDNELSIRNNIRGNANTGDNEADKNTGDGSITTGDASIRVNVKNKGNENITNIRCGECPEENGGQGGGGGPGGEQGGGGQGGGIGGAVEQIAEALGVGGAGPVTLPQAGASVLGLSLISSLLGFAIWRKRNK